jgi:hypothetical protein
MNNTKASKLYKFAINGLLKYAHYNVNKPFNFVFTAGTLPELTLSLKYSLLWNFENVTNTTKNMQVICKHKACINPSKSSGSVCTTYFNIL